jgi:hypothetical protein
MARTPRTRGGAAVAPAPAPTVGARASERTAALAAHRSFPVAALAGIFSLSVLVWALVGSAHAVPQVFPGELVNAKLSQSIASGNGFGWRGSDWNAAPLWPLILSLAWLPGSVPDGYAIGKLLAVLLSSAAVVPVWLLGRELVGERLALVPALLCVAGAWMGTSALLLADNLAYPLAAASLAATVMALRRTGMRWVWISLAFALPAVLARTQLLVLPLILVIALVIDVLVRPRAERRRRMAQRPRALWIGVAATVAALLVALLFDAQVSHYLDPSDNASIGDFGKAIARQSAASVVLFGFVPAAAALALMARRANWRDERSGPLLVTLAAATVVTLLVLGRFEGYAGGGPVDRYVMYLAPLFFLALVMAPARIDRRHALGAAALVALVVLAVPLTTDHANQPGLFGAEARIRALFGDHVRLSLFLFALALTALGSFALTLERRAGAPVAAAIAAVFAVLVAQAWTSQHADIGAIDNARERAPAQLDWVDRRVDERVAFLAVGKQSAGAADAASYTEFFNRHVDGSYSTLPPGERGCRIALGAQGVLTQKDAGCASWPRHFVIQPGVYRATLHGQRVLTTTPAHGALVQAPAGDPRVLALARPPCGARGHCIGQVRLALYLDAPGRLTFTFAGGEEVGAIQAGKQLHLLPPKQRRSFDLPVKAGNEGYALPVNWADTLATPRLTSIILRGENGTTRIY